MYRNHNCGELTSKNVGEQVTLAGWVQKIRNLGAMVFIDLRDQFGITQIVISADKIAEDVSEQKNNTSTNKTINKQTINSIVTECVLQVEGKVVERSNKNPKMSTGEIEIEAQKIEILGKCKNVLPFEINSEKAGEVKED